MSFFKVTSLCHTKGMSIFVQEWPFNIKIKRTDNCNTEEYECDALTAVNFLKIFLKQIMWEKKSKQVQENTISQNLLKNNFFVLSISNLGLMKENDTDFALQCSGNFFRSPKNRYSSFEIYSSIASYLHGLWLSERIIFPERL